MEEVNEELLRRRQELLKNLGVKNAGRMMKESVVSTNGTNSGMAAKLAAIKNGAAKQDFSKYINASGKNAPNAPTEFKGIPEVKKRKNTGQPIQEVDPKYKQNIEEFGVTPIANSGELSAIESMFGGEGSRNPINNRQTNGYVEQNLSLDSMSLPVFNPLAVLQKKAKNQTPENTQSQYLKYASEMPQNINDEFVEPGIQTNQSNINLVMMQAMMEQIAKGVAEKTIKSVLNDYSQQQKNKVFFEYYNKEKGIIKTSDGKFFRITQVELKKKL